MREINVSRAGDPVHAGDKALTWENPVQRGRVNRYDYTCMCCRTSHFFHLKHSFRTCS